MARTTYIDIPDEIRNRYRASIEQRDRYELGVIQGHKRLQPRRQRKEFARGSLFRLLSPIWQGLTEMQKDVWREAAIFSSISGWQLFISDNAARIRNELSYPEPPSQLWQVNTGVITIESPASSIKLKQEHPQDYWVVERKRGEPWKEELVLVEEKFSLPLTIQIRYKTNLSAVSSEQRARYYAEIWTSYQGKDIMYTIQIHFTPSSDWSLDTAELSGIRGIIISYTLYLEVIGYTGTIQLDNIRAIHTGTNWARDPRFDNMDRKFTKAFAVAPPFWVPVDLPEGANFNSQYGG